MEQHWVLEKTSSGKETLKKFKTTAYTDCQKGRKSVRETSRTASCAPSFLHFRRMQVEMEVVSPAELAWSDINHMAWDYTNTVTD